MKTAIRSCKIILANVHLTQILTIGFLISIIWLIRWSDYPLFIDLFPVKLIFLRGPDEFVDSATLSVLSGYATGYMVFMATTYLPSLIRNKPMCEIVYKEMQIFVYESNYLLLSMYKASNEKEVPLNFRSSSDCGVLLRDQVLQGISSMNLLGKSKTPLVNAETPEEILTWLDLITMRSERLINDIEKVALLYHSYLPNCDIQLLNDILNNHFLCIVTGRDRNARIDVTDIDGNKHFLCKIQLRDLIVANRQSNCTFYDLSKGTNALLVDYVQLLTKVSMRLEKKLPDFDSQFATKALFLDSCGFQ